jgi:hypothetical protein
VISPYFGAGKTLVFFEIYPTLGYFNYGPTFTEVFSPSGGKKMLVIIYLFTTGYLLTHRTLGQRAQSRDLSKGKNVDNGYSFIDNGLFFVSVELLSQ